MFLQSFLSRVTDLIWCWFRVLSSERIVRHFNSCSSGMCFEYIIFSIFQEKENVSKQLSTISTPSSLLLANFPFKSIHMRETLVVYYLYLHGQTGWFTVCANGVQNSGLVNFVPESRSLYLYESIPFTAKRARKPGTYWYQRWLWRNGTKIFAWNIPSGKTWLPF